MKNELNLLLREFSANRGNNPSNFNSFQDLYLPRNAYRIDYQLSRVPAAGSFCPPPEVQPLFQAPFRFASFKRRCRSYQEATY